MNDEPKPPARIGQGMDYGEQADVQQVHAAVQREKREPRIGAEPLSVWLDCDLRAGGIFRWRISRSLLWKFHQWRPGSDGCAASGKKSSGGSAPPSRPSNYRRAIAAKRFSQRTVRLVIKPPATACPVNIRHWQVRNLRTADRDAWP